MKLKIKFNTDNAAFEEPDKEIDYILQGIGNAIRLGVTEGPCHDHNGNTVGAWSWS